MRVAPLLILVGLASCADDHAAPDAGLDVAACPAGETCSADFGRYLLEGPHGRQIEPPSDVVSATAVGGTQDFTLRPLEGDVNAVYAGSWHAELSDTDLFDVQRTSAKDLTVTALAAGTSLLDIRDDDGKLIDRVELSAAPVAKAVLVSGLVSGSSPVLVYSPFSLYPGTNPLITVILQDGTGQILVDQGLVITGGTQLNWETISVNATTRPHVTGTATSGFTASFDVSVAAPTTVVRIEDGGDNVPCFEGLDVAGNPVVDAPWTITAPGGEPRQDFCYPLDGTPGDHPLDITIGTFATRVTVHEGSEP